MNTPKAQRLRRGRITRSASLMERSMQTLMHRINEARHRLPPGEDTSIEIVWLAQQLNSVVDRSLQSARLDPHPGDAVVQSAREQRGTG